MKIGEEIEAFGLILHPYPAEDGAEQIAEMQTARRLDARNDPFELLAGHASRFRRFIRIFTSSSTNAPVKKHAAP